MSILRHYQDALFMADQSRHESALTLVLVAVAGAAEKRRRSITGNARKKRGDDPKYFSEYLSQSGFGARIQVGDKEDTLPNILYNRVRNIVIHEARLTEVYDPEFDGTFAIEGMTIRIGPNTIRALARVLRFDVELRNEFRSLFSNYDNISSPIEGDWKSLYGGVAREFDIGRITAMDVIKIIQALTQEKVKSLNEDQLEAELSALFASDNRGAVTEENFWQVWGENPRILDGFKPTEIGFQVFRSLANGMRTVDHGIA